MDKKDKLREIKERYSKEFTFQDLLPRDLNWLIEQLEKERKQADYQSVSRTLGIFEHKLWSRLEEKGYGIFASPHETLGIITEEYQELIEAVKNNDVENFKEELLDIAVGCIFGIVSEELKDE